MKLTEKAALRAMKGYVQLNRKHVVDWHGRRGKVAHSTTPGSPCVLITWDDLKYPDSWPRAAVEKVVEED